MTTSPVADPTNGFSVSAWLAPTAVAGSGQTATAVAESGATGPAFVLQQTGGEWEFRLATRNTKATICVQTAANTEQAGHFTFVTGTWDAGDTNATGPLIVGAATTGTQVELPEPMADQAARKCSTILALARMVDTAQLLQRTRCRAR
jgi:hypothetical protein